MVRIIRSLNDLLTVSVASHGDQVIEDKYRSLTQAQFMSEARLAATRIRILTTDTTTTAPVGIWLEQSLDLAVALFGSALADRTFTLIHHAATPAQVTHQMTDSGCSILLTSEARLRRLQGQVLPEDLKCVTYEDFCSMSGGHDSFTIPRRLPQHVACLIYTSGSTGYPKGVIVPNSTLVEGALTVAEYLELQSCDRVLCALPFSFDYGLNGFLSALVAGASIRIVSYEMASQFCKEVASFGATRAALVPNMWPEILRHTRSGSGARELKSLRRVTSAGGPHSRALVEEISSLLPGLEVVIMYGLTESFRSTYLPAEFFTTKIGSIGKPVPGVDILIINSDGENCATDEPGELIHCGAFVTLGYLGDPDLTASKFVPVSTTIKGSLTRVCVRSGDLVRRDSQGFIYYLGRKDSLMKISGFRVSPTEVESAMCLHERVAFAAAFQTGEPPNACIAVAIVLNGEPDSSGRIEDSSDIRHELQELARNELPSYARPGTYLFLPMIPLTPHGKTDYKALMESVSH